MIEIGEKSSARPQQARSRETERRLVAAARALAEEKDWQDISMAEIARAAKSSVGSLYARFENKQALFDRLDRDYAAELSGVLKALAEEAGNAADLPAAVQKIVSGLIRFHRDNRGLIRALVLATRMERQPDFTARTGEINRIGAVLVEAIRKKAGGSARDESVSWAIFILFTMIRERILFPESVEIKGNPSDATLERETVQAVVSYLLSAKGI